MVSASGLDVRLSLMIFSHSSSKSKSQVMHFYHSLWFVVLVLGQLHVWWTPGTWAHYRCSWLLFLSASAWAGALSWQGYCGRGLLLRTVWASNSCGKCSPHGDRGSFSQTNNSKMFICGSPQGALHVCPCHWTGVCAFDCLAQLFSIF